jgi:hypothetical protein
MDNKNYLEGVRLDFETAYLITRLTLIDSLRGISEDIAALEEKDDLKGHQKEDLEDNMKHQAALLVIIKYFSTADQMGEIESEVGEL